MNLEDIKLSGLPDGSVSEETACNAEDPRLIPGLGRSSAGGNGNSLQYSCLENPMERGAWRATVHGVTKELDTMEELSMHAWRSIGGFSRGKAQFMLHFVRIAWLIYRGETAGGKRSREWRRGCQGGERQDDIIDASYLAWDRPENQTEWRWGFWLLRGVSWGLRSWVMRRGSVMLRTRQALGQTWSGWVESLFLFF